MNIDQNSAYAYSALGNFIISVLYYLPLEELLHSFYNLKIYPPCPLHFTCFCRVTLQAGRAHTSFADSDRLLGGFCSTSAFSIVGLGFPFLAASCVCGGLLTLSKELMLIPTAPSFSSMLLSQECLWLLSLEPHLSFWFFSSGG